MSGRVRWERAHVGRGLGSTDVRGFMSGGVAFDAVRYDDAAPTYATHYDRDGVPDAEETLRRRSDAKRWLLARAAGLAEVPKHNRPPRSFAYPHGYNIEPPAAPRGWRTSRTVGLYNTTVTYERNRRRR